MRLIEMGRFLDLELRKMRIWSSLKAGLARQEKIVILHFWSLRPGGNFTSHIQSIFCGSPPPINTFNLQTNLPIAMPRQSHGRPVLAAPRPTKRKSADRSLAAFAIAGEDENSRGPLSRHRLGEEPDGKRRRIEDEESSSDGQGESDSEDEEKWHVGVEQGEDSEIDSDEAMGEGDEDRFEGFAFRGSQSAKEGKGGKVVSLDLNEDFPDEQGESEDEDESDLGSETVDLATALDMDQEEDGEQASTKKVHFDVPEEGSGSETDSESEDEASVLSVSSEEDLATSHTRLKSFVQHLDQQEATKSTQATPGKLTIEDLLPTVTDPRMKEALKMLHNDAQRGPTTTKSKLGKLEPPLPKRQQDRLDRQVAYEKSKETLSRWIDTVKNNRRAEHLSFPLADPGGSTKSHQLQPTSLSKPLTDLEETLQKIVAENGLESEIQNPDAQAQAFEALQEKKLPLAEVQLRRAELRRNRELLFREEIKARRIKKIKSKAYRRVHRKERDRNAAIEREALQAAGALDSEEERERLHRRRAEERMGQRHRESRWAKGAKEAGRTVWDEEVRAGVTEMARRDEELRKRIEGKEEGEESDSEEDVSIDGYDEVEQQKMLESLEALDQAAKGNVESRLAAMPFMKKAEAERRAANQEEIELTRRMLAGEPESEEDEPEFTGRAKFGVDTSAAEPEKPSTRGEFEERSDEEEEADQLEPASQKGKKLPAIIKKQNGRALQKANHDSPAPSQPARLALELDSIDTPTLNPWLSGPRPRKKTESVSQGPSLITPKPNLLLQKPSALPPNPSSSTILSPPSPDPEGEDDPDAPLPSQNASLVRAAFAGDTTLQETFAAEKKALVASESETKVSTALPGWGSWTGEGLSRGELKHARAIQKKGIVVQKAAGVDERKDRRDQGLKNVVICEKQVKKVRPHRSRRPP